MKKFMWNEFLIDCEDLVGGIVIGIGSQEKDNHNLLIFGVIIVVLSMALKVNKYRQ